MRLSRCGTCLESILLACTLVYASLLGAQAPTSDSGASNEVAPGVHLLTGLSSNVLAITGPTGVLLVDNGSSRDAERLSTLIEQLDSGPVRLAINTHFHFDHVGGNEALGERGTIIVAHERLRARLQAEWAFPDSLGLPFGPLPPYPEPALPSVSLGESTTVNFGGHEIALIHLQSAHTDADLAVLLRDENILHTGDLFASGGFVPPLDSYHGGTIDGWIAAVEKLIELIDDGTKVVPGHGPVADRHELRNFMDVLAISRDRIADLVGDGKTLDEVVAANPMADLDVRNTENFVRTVYADLAGLSSSSGR